MRAWRVVVRDGGAPDIEKAMKFPEGTLVRRVRSIDGYDAELIGIVGIVLENEDDGTDTVEYPTCAWRRNPLIPCEARAIELGNAHFVESFTEAELEAVDERPTPQDELIFQEWCDYCGMARISQRDNSPCPKCYTHGTLILRRDREP